MGSCINMWSFGVRSFVDVVGRSPMAWRLVVGSLGGGVRLVRALTGPWVVLPFFPLHCVRVAVWRGLGYVGAVLTCSTLYFVLRIGLFASPNVVVMCAAVSCLEVRVSWGLVRSVAMRGGSDVGFCGSAFT